MIDETDEKILKSLKENSRMTYVEIGRIVDLSEGAVRNRVQAHILIHYDSVPPSYLTNGQESIIFRIVFCDQNNRNLCFLRI